MKFFIGLLTGVVGTIAAALVIDKIDDKVSMNRFKKSYHEKPNDYDVEIKFPETEKDENSDVVDEETQSAEETQSDDESEESQNTDGGASNEVDAE